MTEPPRVTPTGPRASADTDRILFIGTATTLIQAAGFTILTDPNFLRLYITGDTLMHDGIREIADLVSAEPD